MRYRFNNNLSTRGEEIEIKLCIKHNKQNGNTKDKEKTMSAINEIEINEVLFKEDETIQIKDKHFKIEGIHLNEITKTITIHLDKNIQLSVKRD